MVDQLISAVVSFIVEMISAAGYLGVVVLMAIESACIPLPSEVIMPFAGYLVTIGQFSLVGAATMGALGCNVGSTVAYYVAATGGRKAFEHWGAYILIRPHEIERAEQFFARYGSVTVFVGRLLPVVRTFISLPAGYARMRPARFGVYTAAGCVPWIGGLAWAGYAAGANWPRVQHLVNTPAYIIAGLIALLLIAGIITVIVRRRRRSPASGPRPAAGPVSFSRSEQRRTS